MAVYRIVILFYFILQWLNDLEKDSMYSYWPSQLEEVTCDYLLQYAV